MGNTIKQAVTNALNSSDAFTKCNDTKPKELYVILVNGKRVYMRSGKMVWTGTGPAKNALRTHIHNLLYHMKVNYDHILDEDGRKDYVAERDATKEAEDEWIEKHVVFMPFTEYMTIQKKRST